MKRFFAAVVPLAVITLFAAEASAALINGTLNISGGFRVNGTRIDFTLPQGPPDGDFEVDSDPALQTGSFSGLEGSTGLLLDLDSMLQPTGTPISLPNFMTISGSPITFTLDFIFPGVFPSAQCGASPAPGQICTPPFPPPSSPFNLFNGATGPVASFSVRGTVSDGSGSLPSIFTGTFTTQEFSDPSIQNYQDALARIAAGQFVGASYSATFEATAIPEPATFTMIGAALLLGAALMRKKRR